MFAKSVLYSSLLALAFGKPVARRQFSSHSGNVVPIVGINDGSFFDINSESVTGWDSRHSFNNWGDIPSLHSFDDFYGSNNYCGIRNSVIVQQREVVTCQVTEVTVIQQQLAILAEYAKKVILTQSCETESQVLLFSQWLGNLVGFNQDLRRTHAGRVPTYDSVIAEQITQVVDISTGHIRRHDFGFHGSSIGSHSISVLGGNWNSHYSPHNVEVTWQKVIVAAGPEIHFGTDCSVCSVETHHEVFEEPIETVAHTTVIHEPPVFHTVVHESHETYHEPPVVFHETFDHETYDRQTYDHETFEQHQTIDEHASPVFEPFSVPTIDSAAERTIGSVDTAATVDSAAATATDTIDIASAPAATAASASVTGAASATPASASNGNVLSVPTDDPAAGRRRSWSSRQRA